MIHRRFRSNTATTLLPLLLLPCVLFVPSLPLAHGDETPKPQQPTFDAGAIEFFEKQVRPLLVARCFECHSAQAEKLKGGLRLDSRAAALKGGDTGPAVLPGNAKESLLVDAINYGEIYQMPPKSKLPAAEIAVLTKWVEMGAPWPKDDGAGAAVAVKEFNLQQRKSSHWCWQPVRPQQPPAVANAAWPRSGIDHFILAKLEEKGLTPSPLADKRTLIRRVYFDLIGLPPSPAEVEAFVADGSPQAFEKVVDHLLKSPHFGERWARHWMDLVRYAETYGHEFDYALPHATQYRDYLIRALNEDVPYDQFVIEHLAGDLLEDPRRHPTEGYNESIIGTGFWWLGEATHAPVDVRGDEAGRVDNQIDVMTKTFLGVTVACARCHDHKFDAISTKDYYALAGFLQSSRRQEALLDPHDKIREATKQMRSVKAKADSALAAALPRPSDTAGKEFARYLLAARDVSSGDAAADLAVVAARANVDAARLARWVKAMEDPALNEASHPLRPWRELASRKGELKPQDFAAQRERLTSDAKRAAEEDERAPLFADFNSEVNRGWFVTGEAFGPSPSRPAQWDSQTRDLRAAEPGIAHSGMLSNRLRGVLHSPTFTIEHKNIHFRMAGQGVQIRVIIDGYFMDTFNGLLFRGCSANVDTKGQTVWHTQGGDLGRYLGQRAHLEIIDNGDGFAAIDRICFSDQGPPNIELNTLAMQALTNADVNSLESLAAEYGKVWHDALTSWHDGTIDAAGTRLVNWVLQHELVNLNQPIATLKTQLDNAGRQIDELAKSVPAPMSVLAMTDGSAENERIFIRGNPRTLGDEAPRQLLEALVGPNPPQIERGSGRLELARQIVDPANPLTSRVMANRVWHHLLGRGIVASVDNFGVLGQEPTHPELLDYLAIQFVHEGWSVKQLIRSIVLSRTYQMSSAPDGRGDQLDPQNLLLHRMNIRRLEGEAIRDAILAVSGRLDRKLLGGSVPVHLTPFMQGRGRPGDGPLDGNGRRSIYIAVRRNFLSPMMLAFDTPIPFNSVGARNVSNVPAQALIMMNDPFVVEQASVWAKRLLASPAQTSDERIHDLYTSAFARPPSDTELAGAIAFLAEQGKQYGLTADQARQDPRVWTDLCHVMMNVKEFTFIN
jgi:cytochrome c553